MPEGNYVSSWNMSCGYNTVIILNKLYSFLKKKGHWHTGLYITDAPDATFTVGYLCVIRADRARPFLEEEASEQLKNDDYDHILHDIQRRPDTHVLLCVILPESIQGCRLCQRMEN
jgi:hypothetical protein